MLQERRRGVFDPLFHCAGGGGDSTDDFGDWIGAQDEGFGAGLLCYDRQAMGVGRLVAASVCDVRHHALLFGYNLVVSQFLFLLF